ncbi:MAG: alpha/beta fold hydrolase [Candidatus Binatia bacterium]
MGIVSGYTPERSHRHEDFILDLASLVRHLGKDSVTLIGHSLGGSISMLFAGSFPTKVRKLVLIEAAGPHARSDDDAPELLARWVEGEASQAENSFYLLFPRSCVDCDRQSQRPVLDCLGME